MKKFLFDLTEVIKDIWNGFVWLVEAAEELGEIAGRKFADITTRTPKLTHATARVKRNCVLDD